MTAETAPISREALRLAREQKRLSQRELGRRVATRLGRAEATRAFQVRLSRIEKGDPMTEEDRELVDALAEELALGKGDLAIPPHYIWFRTEGAGLALVGLGLRIIAFSSADAAYAVRDQLAMETGGAALPFKDAQLFPIQGSALTKDVLDTNFGPLEDHERELLIALDPDLDHLLFLWTLQTVAHGGILRFEGKSAYGGTREQLIEQTAAFALQPAYHEFEVELIELHKLALRRLHNAPPEGEHLIDSWKREEEALFLILDRIHELRREQRDAVLER